eukprot:CAMPEP_0115503522 /NCGR_PEP_ID=MMETSP0271-20121206/69523_1 /TAXON_ID=71861 /ORGANISM="Scrippsiella trochoidea, Strain CCMP3099" /LENGTH=211 /DNA_ID=CAMNT_0002932623 /DNA_START=153 /DNA_END=788 /DNA_ORIENTATION=+
MASSRMLAFRSPSCRLPAHLKSRDLSPGTLSRAYVWHLHPDSEVFMLELPRGGTVRECRRVIAEQWKLQLVRVQLMQEVHRPPWDLKVLDDDLSGRQASYLYIRPPAKRSAGNLDAVPTLPYDKARALLQDLIGVSRDLDLHTRLAASRVTSDVLSAKALTCTMLFSVIKKYGFAADVSGLEAMVWTLTESSKRSLELMRLLNEYGEPFRK